MVTLLGLLVVDKLSLQMQTANSGALALLFWCVAMCLATDWAILRLILRKGSTT